MWRKEDWGNQLDGELSYGDIPRNDKDEREEVRLEMVKEWHMTLGRPGGLSDAEYAAFVKFAMGFVLDKERLWRKNSQGNHQLVLPKDRRLQVLREIHDNIGHKRFYSTHEIITQRFWWPRIKADIVWYLRTCHICQQQQTWQLLIPPVVATPAGLFSRVYMDTMHLPAAGGFKYIVQGRCFGQSLGC